MRVNDAINFARDTQGLGNKGIRFVNIGVQCDLKTVASYYKQLEKQNFMFKNDKERMTKDLEVAEKRIERLIGEKNDVLTAFKKI